MFRPLLRNFVCTALLVLGHFNAASAQLCQLDSKQVIYWSPSIMDSFNYTSGFAKSLAISGNTAVVGDASSYQSGTAHIYTHDGAKWQRIDVFHPKDGQNGDLFGTSVAIDGNRIVIGAPHHGSAPVKHGAAYVYELIEGVWTQTAKLTDESVNDPVEMPGEQNLPRRFGTAVAIDGDAIIIGSPEDSQAAFQAGAVYFHQFDQGSWSKGSKFLNENASPTDRLGRNVAIDGARAVAAAIGDVVPLALAFDYDGLNWNHTQVIELPSGLWENNLLTPPVDLHGDALVLGSPLAGEAFSGRAYFYQHDGAGWGPPTELLPPEGDSEEAFGWSVGVSDSHLVVGAPFADISYQGIEAQHNGEDAGAVYVYQRSGDKLELLYRAVADIEWTGQLHNRMNCFGSSIDIDSSNFIVGSPRFIEDDQTPMSTWYFFVEQTDCDLNGEPDYCAPDCNGTRVPDACEIASQASGDCNGNSVPDECETGFHYQVDDGDISTVWGIGSTYLGADFVWLNQYSVLVGHEVVTHIAIAWTALTTSEHPATLAIWDDPNNDGNPSDATLLTSIDVFSTNDFGLNQDAAKMSIYPIPPTNVGSAGSSFFVGAVASVPPGTFVVAADNGGPQSRSWMDLVPLGEADIQVLGDDETFRTSFPSNFLVRALALDCNNNGIWDQCDIDDGVSLDVNANGIPDECEPPCPGDITGDKMTNVDDLLIVINGWGECPSLPEQCPGDINIDDVVNVDDLLAVINDWGPCE